MPQADFGEARPVPAAQDPGILPVGGGTTAVRGVESETIRNPEHTFSEDCAPGFYEKGERKCGYGSVPRQMVRCGQDGRRCGKAPPAGRHCVSARPGAPGRYNAPARGQTGPGPAPPAGQPGAGSTAPVSTTPPALAKASAKASAAGVRSCGPLRKQNPWAGRRRSQGKHDTSCSAARASGRTQVWSVAQHLRLLCRSAHRHKAAFAASGRAAAKASPARGRIWAPGTAPAARTGPGRHRVKKILPHAPSLRGSGP